MKSKRKKSFGQNSTITFIDKFGIWLSSRRIRKIVKNFDNKIVADIGCGFNARFSKTILDEALKVFLVDIKVNPELKSNRKIVILEGYLHEVLFKIPDKSIDVIICNSVLEHLWEPEKTVKEFHRILKDNNGYCFINVPSWAGKCALEFSAFKLGLSPKIEMDDHKDYFTKRSLWKLIRKSGFLPSNIKCHYHKFGLNVFAICEK
jgi:SAM-dependent methyltransferase